MVIVYSVSGTRVGRGRGQVRSGKEVTLLATRHSRPDLQSLRDLCWILHSLT